MHVYDYKMHILSKVARLNINKYKNKSGFRGRKKVFTYVKSYESWIFFIFFHLVFLGIIVTFAPIF